MKYLLLFVLFISANTFGQVVAPDFTLTDIDGNVHHLYEETDAGKTVVLDFFSTICGTCITNTPLLEEIWQNYGYNGDSLWVWGIESTGISDSLTDVFRSTYNVQFPLFGTSNDDVVIYIYNITYTPQYIVVCPDRSMKPYPVTEIENGISLCSSATNAHEHSFDKVKVYSSGSGLYIENKTKNNIELIIEFYDLKGKTESHKISMLSGRMQVTTMLKGILSYRISDENRNIINKGKIYLEQ